MDLPARLLAGLRQGFDQIVPGHVIEKNPARLSLILKVNWN
jgi:hypothetical protein